MEADIVIEIVIGLVLALAALIFLLFLEPKGKKSKLSGQQEAQSDGTHFDKAELYSLMSIIKDRKTDSQKLSDTLELVIKHYGRVHKKLGLRPHPDFDLYTDILFTICRHPNATKDIILEFDRELTKLNPEYKKEINEAIAKGLNSRGL